MHKIYSGFPLMNPPHLLRKIYCIIFLVPNDMNKSYYGDTAMEVMPKQWSLISLLRKGIVNEHFSTLLLFLVNKHIFHLDVFQEAVSYYTLLKMTNKKMRCITKLAYVIKQNIITLCTTKGKKTLVPNKLH